VLTAYNTDYTAIAQLISRNGLQPGWSVLLRGSGGMAKATAAAFRDAGFTDVTMVARNEATGRGLADLYGFGWVPQLGDRTADVLVNVTPIGMAGGPEAESLSFPVSAVDDARVVFDVVALPAETPLITAGRAAGKTVISGAEVATIQALEQFVLYTGMRPTDEQVRAAEEFTRAQ
jgi:shikimate dehydrogenase